MGIIKLILMFGFYLLSFGRMLCTPLMLFTEGATKNFVSESIFIWLLATYEFPLPPILWILGLVIIVGLWITIIMSSIMGIKNKKARRISILSIMVLAVFDCILPIIYSDITIKINSSIISAVIILLGVFCLLKKSKKAE